MCCFVRIRISECTRNRFGTRFVIGLALTLSLAVRRVWCSSLSLLIDCGLARLKSRLQVVVIATVASCGVTSETISWSALEASDSASDCTSLWGSSSISSMISDAITISGQLQPRDDVNAQGAPGHIVDSCRRTEVAEGKAKSRRENR